MIKHENSTSEKKIADDKPSSEKEKKKKRSILLSYIMVPAKVFTMDSASTIILSKQILLFANKIRRVVASETKIRKNSV